MSFQKIWTNYELFFYHEFINDSDFPDNKREILEMDLGHYYVSNDFTIYQEKSIYNEAINIDDYNNNYLTVLIMLNNMPVFKAVDFIEFHYEKYPNDKKKFLKNVLSEFNGAKFSQGDNQIPLPIQFQIVLKWCKEKLEELENTYQPKRKGNKTFVNLTRISALKNTNSNLFDLKKLVKLLEEINDNFAMDNFLSVAILGRSVLDHIPPIFKLRTFNEVVNNFGSSSFKKNMSHLNNSMRSIADNYLHTTIREKESLPNENQVDFSRELDFLLAEILRTIQ